MIHRTQIMKEAWAIYRKDTRLCRPSTVAGRRAWFGRALRTAWAWAKQRIVDAAKTEAETRAERIDAIRDHIANVNCKTFRYRTGNELLRLEAELMRLTRHAA